MSQLHLLLFLWPISYYQAKIMWVKTKRNLLCVTSRRYSSNIFTFWIQIKSHGCFSFMCRDHSSLHPSPSIFTGTISHYMQKIKNKWGKLIQPVRGIQTKWAWPATEHLECLNTLLTLVCTVYNRQLLKKVICSLKNEQVELESGVEEIAGMLDIYLASVCTTKRREC